MRMPPSRELVARLRESRHELRTFLFATLFAGVAVGWAAILWGEFVDWCLGSSIALKLLVFVLVILLTILVGLAASTRLARLRVSQRSDWIFVLPVLVKREHVFVRAVEGYLPSTFARDTFARRHGVHGAVRAAFALVGGRPPQYPFEGEAGTILSDLVAAVLVKLIHAAGDDLLDPCGGPFHSFQFSDLSPEGAKLDPSFRENRFLKALTRKNADYRIWLPRGARLTCLRRSGGTGKTPAPELLLEYAHMSVRFRVAALWAQLGPQYHRRSFETLERGIRRLAPPDGVGRNETATWPAEVTVSVEVDIGDRALRRGGENKLAWVEDLVTFLGDRFDWTLYLDRQQEMQLDRIEQMLADLQQSVAAARSTTASGSSTASRE